MAVATLGAGLLLSTTPAAHAAVFTDGTIESSSNSHEFSDACQLNETSTGTDTSVDVIENGGPVSNTATVHTDSFDSSDDTDDPAVQATSDLSDTTTAELKASGDNIAGITMSSTSSVRQAAIADSPCDPSASIDSRVNFDFTVTTPGYLNFGFTQQGAAYGEFEIEASNSDSDVYYDIESEYVKSASTHSVYLPAGEYEGYYESDPYTENDNTGTFVPVNQDSSISLNATFTPDGTVVPTPPTSAAKSPSGLQASPSVGRGVGFASLPLARSCPTGTVTENVTSRKKLAKRISKVSVFVDGAKVLTVKHPKAGQALTVPVADTGVTRTVVTKVSVARGHGKNAKVAKYQSATTYLPCS